MIRELRLVVIEQDSPLAEFFPEDLVLATEVFDHLLQFAVDPAGQAGKKDVRRA
jgi:hypothetical protein